jgi:hypothetical protein
MSKPCIQGVFGNVLPYLFPTRDFITVLKCKKESPKFPYEFLFFLLIYLTDSQALLCLWIIVWGYLHQAMYIQPCGKFKRFFEQYMCNVI